ncbi:MAG: hypothetical protein ABF242_10420 [Flavobacteriales bacterium]
MEINKEQKYRIECDNLRKEKGSTNFNDTIFDSFLPESENEIQEILAVIIFKNLMKREKFKKYNSNTVLYNRRFIIKIFIRDKLIFSTENEKFKNLYEKLKFNSKDKSKRKFLKLLYYMLDVEFSPSSFINDITYVEKKEETNFTITQKIRLLEGMESGKARKLAKLYFEKKEWTKENLIEVDEFISKASKKYGMDLLMKLLKMNKLPETISNSKRVYTFFDSRNLDSIKIALNKNQEFTIHKDKISNSISIKKNDKKLYQIDNKGKLTGEIKIERFNPTLALFLSFINDPINQIVHFGAETKKCSFCNLKLEDPKSLIVGYGLKCAETNNMPWG